MPFDDWSWTAHGGRSAGRSRGTPLTYERATFQQTLAYAAALEPEIINRTREALVYQAQNWCDSNGYRPGDRSWDSVPQDSFATVTIRLTTEITPRTDGEWPAIRRAILEDERDRQTALADRGRVDDRLDALKRSAAIWMASTPSGDREALRRALSASTADE